MQLLGDFLATPDYTISRFGLSTGPALAMLACFAGYLALLVL